VVSYGFGFVCELAAARQVAGLLAPDRLHILDRHCTTANIVLLSRSQVYYYSLVAQLLASYYPADL
jgi:hypothetical protein